MRSSRLVAESNELRPKSNFLPAVFRTDFCVPFENRVNVQNRESKDQTKELYQWTIYATMWGLCNPTNATVKPNAQLWAPMQLLNAFNGFNDRLKRGIHPGRITHKDTTSKSSEQATPVHRQGVEWEDFQLHNVPLVSFNRLRNSCNAWPVQQL